MLYLFYLVIQNEGESSKNADLIMEIQPTAGETF